MLQKCLPIHSPENPICPEYPFHHLWADLFETRGFTYLVIVDGYSNWPIIFKCENNKSGTIIKAFRKVFIAYGAPSKITTDGGKYFVSAEFAEFMKTWKISHKHSSAYNPHSNLRSECAVKSVKKIVFENMDRTGGLNNDKFSFAILAYRNTPCRYLGQSPATILFARQLRGGTPMAPGSLQLRPEWLLTARNRELALAKHHLKSTEFLSRSSQEKTILEIGQSVSIQNQHGRDKNKWDCSGVIVENL